MIRALFLCFVFIFFVGLFSSPAQELLVPLTTNPTIEKAAWQHQPAGKTDSDLVLTLPFRDDFSIEGPYPDPGFWADQFVFVNNYFAFHPKTAGVATFDAFDQHGAMYDHLTTTNTPLVADYLTSHRIRLDSVFEPSPRRLGPNDNVVLSFYYQPQGRGGDPLFQDSLVLEFLHTPGYDTTDEEGNQVFVEDDWRSVWHAAGESLAEFSLDTFPFFKRVAVQITDAQYFRNDFRFRFKNHVSFPPASNQSLYNYTGNRNIWNIDYVYLDRNRNVQNTSYFDIAFANPAQSILANYTSMPWSHYIVNPQDHLKANLSMLISNLDNAIYPYSYRYFIRDEQGNIIRNYSGGTWNIAPFATHGYQQYQPHASPIVIGNPLPAAPADERHFDIVHLIRAGIAGDDHQQNDTVVYRQSFSNYFAYDDGVPEAGYGVTGRFPKIAKRFVAAKNDQLTAIDIWFNQTLTSHNADRPFKIMIWKNIGDNEELLYQSDDALNTDPEEGFNRFARFELDRAVDISDTFYIGMEQQGIIGINEFLSIGFDFNNNAGKHLFYYINAEWLPSIEKGALMIRPVFQSRKTVGIPKVTERQQAFVIYPNPVSGTHMTISNVGDLPQNPHKMDIIDAVGRNIYSGDFRQTFNTGDMPNGVYFLRIHHSNGSPPEAIPFIIAR